MVSELNSTFPLDSVKKSFVATSYLAKFDAFEKNGKENVLRRERKRERSNGGDIDGGVHE